MAKGEKRVSKTGKTYYYDPAAAKARRDRMKAFAEAGGYEPQKRVGLGLSELRVSKKTGATYRYTPWSKLTADQKRSRLDYAKREREYAKAYKREKGIGQES